MRGPLSVASRRPAVVSILSNPALPAKKPFRELNVVSESGYASDLFGGILYGTPIKKGMVSAGILYYDAGTIELNWFENGTLVTEQKALERDLMGIVSYARPVSRLLRAGISLKAARSEMVERETAYAVAVDAGLAADYGENLSLSVAALNYGTGTAFLRRADPLPSAISVACSRRFKAGPVRMSASAGAFQHIAERVFYEAGLEIGYGVISLNAVCRCPSDEGSLRFGLELLSGATLIGYSVMPGNALDTVHRLTVGIRFLPQLSAASSSH